jgi:hypothetical protein
MPLRHASASFFTGGVRPMRADGPKGRSHPFPFPLPAYTIGEEKAKCQGVFFQPSFSISLRLGHVAT